MSTPRGKRQTEGPLKDHYKQGKTFRTAMTAYEETRVNDWVKEDLPDLLWPALFAQRLGSAGASEFRKLQEAVIRIVGEESLDEFALSFDGRLSSLECFPDSLRPSLIAMLTGPDWIDRAMVDDMCSILRWYDNVPGAWLLVDPIRDRTEARDADANLLVRIIVDVVKDGHLDALVKYAPFSWLLLRGKISFGQEMVDLLRDYPLNEATRSMADSAIRASFGAHKGAVELNHPERFERSRDMGPLVLESELAHDFLLPRGRCSW